MKSFLVNSNNWYDSLPPLRRLLFFLIVIAGTQQIALYFSFTTKHFWIFNLWCLLFLFWRVSVVFINWRKIK